MTSFDLSFIGFFINFRTKFGGGIEKGFGGGSDVLDLVF